MDLLPSRWHVTRQLMAAICILLSAAPSAANDSVGNLAAGGIELARTEDIQMRSEDLYVSAKEIRVRYRFFNNSAHDIQTLVAFPMPEIPALSDVANYAVPFEDEENFLGLQTKVDNKLQEMSVEQRAFALGLDRSQLLRNLGIPMQPFSSRAPSALEALSDDARAELRDLGLIRVEEVDTGKGPKATYFPRWTLRTTYYWTQVFPSAQEVVVEHRYAPSVGASTGTLIGASGTLPGALDDYKERYCIDEPFIRAATSAQREAKQAGRGGLSEQRIGYILVTGANWAGPIAEFHLTVDKGRPDNLVSFCGEGLEKTSPTQFELRKSNYWPDRNLEVVILVPIE